MSEPRIVNIMEFLDRSSRVINLKIRLRMTALQFGILHSTNKPDALQNRGRLSKRLRILLYATFKRLPDVDVLVYCCCVVLVSVMCPPSLS